MKKSLRIVFFGNERIATGLEAQPHIFNWLVGSGHEVVALVVHSSSAKSRRTSSEPIIEIAKKHAIPVLNPERPSEITDQLRELSPDCGVLVAYGKIVPQEVIDLFPEGILNLHPSLLPKLRGSTPIETALLEGLPLTGVSIMSLVKEMDAGPIHEQLPVAISAHMSKQELAETLHKLGREAMETTLRKLIDGTLYTAIQNESEATFTKRLKKEDGLLDWNKPATQLEAETRAFAGWPKSYFVHHGRQYVVLQATVMNESVSDEIGTIVVGATSIAIQTTSGSLGIITLQPEGKKPMRVNDFLNGYRNIF